MHKFSWRRRVAGVVALAGLALAGCSASTTGPAAPAAALATSAPTGEPAGTAALRERLETISTQALGKYDLKALIVQVRVDGKDVYTVAKGESMTGVPATADMRVRNGFMAYSYLTTLLMRFVDQKRISLDDKLSKYLPELPRSSDITIKMLANSTSGYGDFVYQPSLLKASDDNPFRQWTASELIRIGTSAPATFAPGTNFAYSHTNYVILGTVLAKIAGEPLDRLMIDEIFEPMGLRHTSSSPTPEIPSPVLHTFSSQRRVPLEVPKGIPFYEDSTYWNPSWTVPEGASQTQDIADLTTSITAIGTGKLLTPASYEQQTGALLEGFGRPQEGCPACRTNTSKVTFAMGLIRQGPWITGNKFYAGSGAVFGYEPGSKVAISVITTYQPSAWDDEGAMSDAGPALFREYSAAADPANPLP